MGSGWFLSDQLERAKVNVQMSLLHHAGFGQHDADDASEGLFLCKAAVILALAIINRPT